MVDSIGPSAAGRDDALRPAADRLYVATALGIETSLAAFFALRMWAFDTAIEAGWIVYALAVPALCVSAVVIRAGRPAYFWVAGVIYAAWAGLGFVVDVASPIAWRSPIAWQVFLPYVALFLAAQMLYWWPLGRVDRRLWLAFALLFAVSTALNIGSHA